MSLQQLSPEWSARKPKLRLAIAVTAAFAAALGVPAAARADVAAVYAEGHGGLESGGATPLDGDGAGGVGFRLGARLLIFEGYYDYTNFGGSAAVSRGIVGLRGGFGTRDLRLVLRAGGGVIDERGGALTGRSQNGSTGGLDQWSDHVGAVGRIGAALEARLAPMFLVGLGVDGETYVLSGSSAPGSSGAIVGSDVFANLHLMFEVGL